MRWHQRGEPGEVERTAVRELVKAARARGEGLTGPDELRKSITKQVLEAAPEEELTEHLGHEKHRAPSGGRRDFCPSAAGKGVLRSGRTAKGWPCYRTSRRQCNEWTAKGRSRRTGECPYQIFVKLGDLSEGRRKHRPVLTNRGVLRLPQGTCLMDQHTGDLGPGVQLACGIDPPAGSQTEREALQHRQRGYAETEIGAIRQAAQHVDCLFASAVVSSSPLVGQRHQVPNGILWGARRHATEVAAQREPPGAVTNGVAAPRRRKRMTWQPGVRVPLRVVHRHPVHSHVQDSNEVVRADWPVRAWLVKQQSHLQWTDEHRPVCTQCLEALERLLRGGERLTVTVPSKQR